MFKVKMLPFFNAETDEGGASGEGVTPEVEKDTVPDAGEHEQVEQVDDNDTPDTPETDDEDDLPELPPEQKTAFQKRMEREQRKLEEKLRGELEQTYKGQYSKHERIIQALGGDVDSIEKALEEQRIINEANRHAEQNGWSEDETRWYINEQKVQQELHDLRISNQINELRDNPDFAGIRDMKKDISDMVKRSNGNLTVEQAYWALGGKARAEQLKREVEQREVAKRTQAKRTVQTDSAPSSVGEKPLPADIEAQRKKLGLTVEQARELLKDDAPKNLAEWREKRKK